MPPRVTDDLDHVVDLVDAPARVVSLVPSVTELVCAFGCADRLIAVTRYCTHPPDVVARLPKVGGTKNPDCAAIAALRPDVVLMNAEENRREDAAELERLGVPIFTGFPRTVPEAARSIAAVGRLLGVAEIAARHAEAVDAARTAALAAVRRRRQVFCPIWRKPWMTFNRDTFVHDLLACAGANNICADATDRYPVIDLDAVARAEPDVILLPDEPYHFRRRHLADLGALAATPAWRDGRIHFVDGRALTWYGARTPAALEYFVGLLQSTGPAA